MKRKPKPSDYICRPDHGGCGRRIVIVGAPYKQSCGATRRTGLRAVAVHADEVGDRKSTTASLSTILKARGQLEDSCAAKKEQQSTPLDLRPVANAAGV